MASHCVAVVDPYSTGCCVALEAFTRGYKVIAVWSRDASEELKAHRPLSCKELTYLAEVTQLSTIEETAEAVKAVVTGECDLVACMVGGESGVPLADALSERLGLRTNGTAVPQRRDKKLQQELVKMAGLRSVRQAGGVLWSDIQGFVETEPMPVVVKPVESAGSDGVKLCHTKQEVEEHFQLLMNAQQKVGSQDAAVLVQECLRGKEYVVDHVSLDGEHKTVMLWVYDKRPVNGAAFVYYGMQPVPSDSPEAKLLIPYIRGVLDALQIKNGPTHGEAIMTESGPCLVEMNCRAHGADGTWQPLARALTGGYSQVGASVDCFLNEVAFHRLPERPPSPFKAAGEVVMLVSMAKGKVKATPGYEKIRAMASYVWLEAGVQVGSEVEHTTDLFTCVGAVVLMHAQEAVVRRDVEAMRQMETECSLFELEEHAETLGRPRSESVMNRRRLASACSSDGPGAGGRLRVFSAELSPTSSASRTPKVAAAAAQCMAIVDPYSTGCCVALEAFNRGYKVIALWSKESTDELKAHRPLSCKDLEYMAEIDEKPTLEETAEAVRAASGGLELAGVVVGGESGVPLADALSEKMGVRTNGTAVPQRRDKKVQQELVKEAGQRSVRQAGGTSWSDVADFVASEAMPVVVKPVESAGSDGVKLCHTKEEAEEHFHVLMNAQQKVGSQGAAVLVQEFLRGKEYVVDHVSRDGVHKTVMVWVYDKRPANGSAFVYHGMLPVPSDSPEAKVLIPYIRGVLDALQIKNGPTHGEAMMTENGPCLVEMNCRAHGGDGTWTPLAKALTGGYCQVDAAIDSFVDEAAFKKLPDRPPSPFKASGQEVMLVSFAEGRVAATPGYDKIRAMSSFVYLETGIEIGSQVEYTTDLFTNVGSTVLMHKSSDVVAKDVAAIRQMEKECSLFLLEEHAQTLGRPRTTSEMRPHCSDLVEENPADQGGWCTLL